MYAVMFNNPDWKVEWGYTKRTLKDTKNEAKKLMQELNNKNPDCAYKVKEL
mgnify:CR=1 FL=1|jgi:hypothetical protein